MPLMRVSTLTLDYHTFDFDEHIAQVFVSNREPTEVVVEEYVSKNLEFVHDEKASKENIFSSIVPHSNSNWNLNLEDEEVPDIPFEETPKSEGQ